MAQLSVGVRGLEFPANKTTATVYQFGGARLAR
jgi:hypothetical protein